MSCSIAIPDSTRRNHSSIDPTSRNRFRQNQKLRIGTTSITCRSDGHQAVDPGGGRNKLSHHLRNNNDHLQRCSVGQGMGKLHSNYFIYDNTKDIVRSHRRWWGQSASSNYRWSQSKGPNSFTCEDKGSGDSAASRAGGCYSDQIIDSSGVRDQVLHNLRDHYHRLQCRGVVAGVVELLLNHFLYDLS